MLKTAEAAYMAPAMGANLHCLNTSIHAINGQLQEKRNIVFQKPNDEKKNERKDPVVPRQQLRSPFFDHIDNHLKSIGIKSPKSTRQKRRLTCKVGLSVLPTVLNVELLEFWWLSLWLAMFAPLSKPHRGHLLASFGSPVPHSRQESNVRW